MNTCSPRVHAETRFLFMKSQQASRICLPALLHTHTLTTTLHPKSWRYRQEPPCPAFTRMLGILTQVLTLAHHLLYRYSQCSQNSQVAAASHQCNMTGNVTGHKGPIRAHPERCPTKERSLDEMPQTVA